MYILFLEDILYIYIYIFFFFNISVLMPMFYKYSSIQMKCQGGNKYALIITIKFDQSTRRFGRISFARLFKFTKHIALLFYLLSPYLLSCMRGSRNVRTICILLKQ